MSFCRVFPYGMGFVFNKTRDNISIMYVFFMVIAYHRKPTFVNVLVMYTELFI